MNYSTYRFTLDIHRTKSQVSIPVLYGDTGIQFYISMTDGGKPYFIEDGCRAVFSAKKPDGTVLFNDCIIEANTRILYQFTEQTTNVEGMMNCELRLYGKDGNIITTPCFVVVVDPRVVYDTDLDESKPEATAIDNMMRAEVARAEAEAGRVEAEEGRVTAEDGRVAAESERDVKITEAVHTINEAVGVVNAATDAIRESLGSYIADIDAIVGAYGYFTVVTPYDTFTYSIEGVTTWREFVYSEEAQLVGWWIDDTDAPKYQPYRIMLGDNVVEADDVIHDGAAYTTAEATQEAMSAWSLRRG